MPGVGTCSITSALCTADDQCPNQPGPTNPLPAFAATPVGSAGIALTTLLADANGLGKACRRNNHAYASDGTTAGQTNYPSGKFTTPVTGEISAGLGCHATDRYAAVPRHYWKTEVEWCDNRSRPAATSGWATARRPAASCQAFKDATHVYPRFYQFGAAPGTDNVQPRRVRSASTSISPTTRPTSMTGPTTSGTAQTITRTFAEEMTNYANWFAYYRTRILAVKTVTSLAFLGKTGSTLNLDEVPRRLPHAVQATGPSFVDIADFDADAEGGLVRRSCSASAFRWARKRRR